MGSVPGSSGIECNLPASYLVVPILVATQGIHRSTYIVTHVVGRNAPKLHQANKVPPPLEGPFLHTKHLGEMLPYFWKLLIDCHT